MAMARDREEAALLPRNSLVLSAYGVLAGIWSLSQLVVVRSVAETVVVVLLRPRGFLALCG